MVNELYGTLKIIIIFFNKSPKIKDMPMSIPGVFLNTVDGGRANGSVAHVHGVPGKAALRGSVRAGPVRV